MYVYMYTSILTQHFLLKVKGREHQLEVSEEQQRSLKGKTLQDEKMTPNSQLKTKELELTSQLDGLRAKVGK